LEAIVKYIEMKEREKKKKKKLIPDRGHAGFVNRRVLKGEQQ